MCTVSPDFTGMYLLLVLLIVGAGVALAIRHQRATLGKLKVLTEENTRLVEKLTLSSKKVQAMMTELEGLHAHLKPVSQNPPAKPRVKRKAE